ncbi:host cell factor [Pelomyxa schiedti]|nr:host cell factor [Pelomyxa schiedti]
MQSDVAAPSASPTTTTTPEVAPQQPQDAAAPQPQPEEQPQQTTTTTTATTTGGPGGEMPEMTHTKFKVDTAAAEAAKAEGNALFNKGDYEQAIKKYDAALESNPRDWATYSNRSLCRFRQGNYPQAVGDALMCVRLNKNWPKGYYRLGTALAAVGNPVKALDAFQVGLVAAPDNAELREAAEMARQAIKKSTIITWQPMPAVGRTGEPPTRRCAHSASVIGPRIFCFGGFGNGKVFNSFTVIDTETNSTEELHNPSWKIPVRASHSAVVYGSSIIVFGGYDGSSTFYNDVWQYEVLTGTWTEWATKGTKPHPRGSHTACVFGHKMFIFGGMAGQEDASTVFSDLHVLNLRTQKWSQPTVTGKSPDARNSHAATIVGNNMVVIGGCNTASKYYNDVWFLDLGTFRWNQAGISNPEAFEPRMGLTIACLDFKIYVYGGLVIKDNSYRSEIWVLDTLPTPIPQSGADPSTSSPTAATPTATATAAAPTPMPATNMPAQLTWEATVPRGRILVPRVGHSMSLVRGYKFVVHGGDGGPEHGIMQDLHVAFVDLAVQHLLSPDLAEATKPSRD